MKNKINTKICWYTQPMPGHRSLQMSTTKEMIETDTSFSASSFHNTDVPWVQTETNNREMDSVSLSHNTSNTTLRGGDALQTGRRDKIEKRGLQL